ncbi:MULTISPECIES: TetR/AcrR family transcriptional regulator C-terminal domain-containing protein [unclassified Rhizobium]|jgi:AcrR family transcriptional regulator|uniref:TetR/AcrR family transcriptional regulator C-terminal domain-containing protein n=1 Tax=unclassified Rhizobium TaxID=2613769 RepID=UPI0021E760B9|nr:MULTISPECIES: TetR/AcrR family transcriptional regulator C-terminal domain-containing protein [unclassified Rhizobium]MCV3764513.1 TetR/AcrR family transcriptional regulator C-terminal domain-containing protein [Rhizobium sp. TRM95796]MDH6267811.1 AcrR family transcriptional regulator [Rhizobium sp. SG_E_25_P2]
MLTTAETNPDQFSPRQNAVLEEALRLLVSGGEKALTTAGVARAANCSKESLYKWFGDRDGLMEAMIAYQASKVKTGEANAGALTRDSLEKMLDDFAIALLDVLSGDVSLALNRLAIGQASRDGSQLGEMLLERGRKQIGRRAATLLIAAKRARLIEFDDVTEAYEVLYGLIVKDWHVRLLLGEDMSAAKKEFGSRAKRAVAAFLRLYGTDKGMAG